MKEEPELDFSMILELIRQFSKASKDFKDTCKDQPSWAPYFFIVFVAFILYGTYDALIWYNLYYNTDDTELRPPKPSRDKS